MASQTLQLSITHLSGWTVCMRSGLVYALLVEDDLQPVGRLWVNVVPETAVLQETVVVHQTGGAAPHL